MGLSFNEMAHAIETNPSYDKWLESAKQIEQSHINKYGHTLPGWAPNFENIKNQAQRHYFEGDLSRTQREWLKNTTNQLLLSKPLTPENILDFVRNEMIPKIENPDNPAWKLIVPNVLNEIIHNMDSVPDAMEVIESFNDLITPEQKDALINSAEDIPIRKQKLGTELLTENHEMVKRHHDVGVAVDEHKIISPEDLEKNRFIVKHGLGRKDAQELQKIADETGRYDIIDPIYNNLISDFRNDFVAAMKRRNPLEDVEPLVMPKIAPANINIPIISWMFIFTVIIIQRYGHFFNLCIYEIRIHTNIRNVLTIFITLNDFLNHS
jgi:hypothetical protein